MSRTSPRRHPTAAGPGGHLGHPHPRGDPLRRGVQVLLLLYLLPAVLAVLVLGGLLVLLEWLARRVGAHFELWRRRGARGRRQTAGGRGRPCNPPPESPGAPRRERALTPTRGPRGE